MIDVAERLETHAGFLCRVGTSDAPMVAGCYTADEYRILGRKLAGWAIDVGAHIGSVAVLMARTYPSLRVLAVEAVPDNVAMIERNIVAFGLQDRVTAIHAFAAGPSDLTGTCHYGYRHSEGTEAEEYVRDHRFVGNAWRDTRDPSDSLTVPASSLDALLSEYAIEDVSLLKIDCEGCEWAFLDTPAVSRVRTIVGEYHSNAPGRPSDSHARLAELLPDHDIAYWTAGDNGLFEAVRRG